MLRKLHMIGTGGYIWSPSKVALRCSWHRSSILVPLSLATQNHIGYNTHGQAVWEGILMPTAAIYARYSPGRDRDKTSTIEAQIAMCEEKARAESFTVDRDHIYIDRGISGATVKRDAFQQMLEAIKEGTFPHVLYAKDDKRLFRNEREAGELVEWIWEQDVEIRYCLINFGDPRSSDEQWFMQRQFHLFAELERRRKAKEVHEHQRQNALAGYANGGIPPYGYKRSEVFIQDETGTLKKKLKWELDPDTAPAVERAFQMFLNSEGAKSIATALNKLGYRSRRNKPMNQQSLLEWFRRPFVFAGCVVWNMHDRKQHPKPRSEWVMVEHAHPAIITMQQAEAAYQKSQKRKKQRKETRDRVREGTYLLTGLLKCSECGKNFVINSYKKRNEAFYVCGTRQRRTSGCSNGIHLHQRELERQVEEWVHTQILEPGFAEAYFQRVVEAAAQDGEGQQQREAELRQELAEVSDRLKELLMLMADRQMPREELTDLIREQQARKTSIEEALARQEARKPKTIPPEALAQFREELAEALSDSETKKVAIRGLIQRIIVHPDGDLEVEYALVKPGHNQSSATALPPLCEFEGCLCSQASQAWWLSTQTQRMSFLTSYHRYGGRFLPLTRCV